MPGRVSTLEEGTTLKAITDIMANSNELYFPVRGADDTLTGILGVKDIRKVIFETALFDLVVASEIAGPPATLLPSDNLYAALLRFVDTGYGQIPVVRRTTHVHSGAAQPRRRVQAYRAAVAALHGEEKRRPEPRRRARRGPPLRHPYRPRISPPAGAARAAHDAGPHLAFDADGPAHGARSSTMFERAGFGDLRLGALQVRPQGAEVPGQARRTRPRLGQGIAARHGAVHVQGRDEHPALCVSANCSASGVRVSAAPMALATAWCSGRRTSSPEARASSGARAWAGPPMT